MNMNVNQSCVNCPSGAFNHRFIGYGCQLLRRCREVLAGEVDIACVFGVAKRVAFFDDVELLQSRVTAFDDRFHVGHSVEDAIFVLRKDP